MEFFLKGIVAGFIIAVPIGPVAILCFRRVLTERPLFSFVSVLGAATADAIYGLLAAFGLTAVSHLLLVHRTSLKVAGGLLIIGLGVTMLRANPPADGRSAAAPRNHAAAYFGTLLLMLANPSVIVSLVAVFAAIGLGEGPPRLEGAWIGAGVLIGSSAWWLVYRLVASWLGDRLQDKTIATIDHVSGGLLCAFGAWQLVATLLLHR